jgi:hypothetical protein
MSPLCERRHPLRIPFTLSLLLLPGAGCMRDPNLRERGAVGLYDTAQEVAAPKEDRCAKQGAPDVAGPCEEARSKAWTYVRRLAIGDQVCLGEGFGEPPDAACPTRATVDDAAPGRVLLQIREARPESKWFPKVGQQTWFAEGALVDLYLAERGF